jgi:hypothetical protein
MLSQTNISMKELYTSRRGESDPHPDISDRTKFLGKYSGDHVAVSQFCCD